MFHRSFSVQLGIFRGNGSFLLVLECLLFMSLIPSLIFPDTRMGHLGQEGPGGAGAEEQEGG